MQFSCRFSTSKYSYTTIRISNYYVGSAYWKEGGLESPMPPVLSAGGGGRGGGGGEGWVVVSTGGTTATGGSAAGVSEDTNWKKRRKKGLDNKREEQNLRLRV